MTMARADAVVVGALLREEWRVHTRLFGGGRFAGFPVFVAAVGAGAVWLLVTAGIAFDAVVAGLHALVFAVGLHSGSVGLVGRDAVRNLVGDATFVVFSARTLPITTRRLLALFLLKEAGYYAGLFLVPLGVALLPAGGVGFLPHLPTVWLSTVGTFVLGVTVTLAALALATRGVGGLVVGALVAVAGGGLWAAGVDLVAWTPYGFYRDPSPAAVVTGVAPLVPLVLLGVLGYDPSARRRVRTRSGGFERWRRRFGDADGVMTKSVLDVARSSGGLWKLPFSAGILFAVVAFLLRLVEPITGVTPSVGVSFGALLGLTGFTTFNWLTQFDEPAEYFVYPLGVAELFAAKLRAFLLLGVPIGTGAFLLAVALYGGRPLEIGAGLLLVVGIELYLFGVTVYLTGVEPNEFLFDTALFAAFTAAVAVVLVPILIAGFVLAPLSAGAAALTGAAGAVAAVAGVALYRASIPKWDRRLRRR